MNLEDSQFHYIDQIDSIRELEFLYNESLNMGDTLKSISVLMDIVAQVEPSSYYSDEFISNYYYKIGHLYLLINEPEKSETFFLKSIDSYNNSMLRNQLLMEAPLLDLQSLYKNKKDSINFNVTSSRIQKIKELKNHSLLDSIKYSKISLETFDESISNEELDNIYSHINLSEQAFEQGLYSQSIENLIASLNFNYTEVSYEYYYNLPILDSTNIEYVYIALENSLKTDSLNYKSYDFLNSIINIKLEKYDDALILAENYYTNKADDVKSYNLLADIYFRKEMWSEALFYYFRTLLNDKDNLRLRFKISNCMQYMGEYEKAIYNLNYILKIDPYFYDAYLELGKMYLLQENFKKSQQILTDFLLFKPNSKEGYYYLGVSYFNLNKYNFAMDAFNKTVSIDNSYANAHYYLGLINESILKYDKAEYHYEKAKNGGTSFYEMNFNYGKLLYGIEKYKKAIDPLEDYIDYYEYDNNDFMSDNYKEALNVLGDIFFNEQRYSESVSTYKKLINKYPEDLFFNERLAKSFSLLKNYEKAIKAYENILNLYSDNIDSMLQLGNIFFEKGDYYNAIDYYNQVINCDNKNKDAIYKVALCYAYTDKFFQALIAFKRAHIIEPENLLIMYQIGVTYMELKIYDQAILYFNNNQTDSDSQFMMGICYYQLKDYNRAIDYFLLYLNKEKNNSQLYYYIGLCYYFLEDYQKSAKNLKISLKTDESNIDALSKLGITYIKLNKKREAQKIANKLYYLDKREYNLLDKSIKSQNN